MDTKLPQNLIFPNSVLHIAFEENSSINKTNQVLILSGTCSGFLSLANALLFYVNSLEEKFDIHLFPFVESPTIRFTIEVDEALCSTRGDIVRIGKNNFHWKLSEFAIDQIAALIHSLGHINRELHLDEGKAKNDVSVYCVVE